MRTNNKNNDNYNNCKKKLYKNIKRMTIKVIIRLIKTIYIYIHIKKQECE
jgi:hypothetical protein